MQLVYPDRAPSPGAPTVFMPYAVHQKLMAYVQLCPIEVNGFGYVDQLPDGALYISDVFILEQVATAGDVTMDERALAMFASDLMRRGGNPSRVFFQWHSHVGGQAYFSGTDTANIERWQGDIQISFVTNHRGEYSCRLDTYTRLDGFDQPIRTTVYDIEIAFIDEPLSVELQETVAAELTTKVKRRGGILRRALGKQTTPGVLVRTRTSPLPVQPLNERLLPESEGVAP